jgi:LysM repeat protein
VVIVLLAGCGGAPRASPTATANLVLTIVTPTVSPAKPDGAASSAAPQRYVVQEGDTLSSIAARFGVTGAALQRANDLADPNAIFVGQELTIPDR